MQQQQETDYKREKTTHNTTKHAAADRSHRKQTWALMVPNFLKNPPPEPPGSSFLWAGCSDSASALTLLST
jgi:hypothetical protein